MIAAFVPTLLAAMVLALVAWLVSRRGRRDLEAVRALLQTEMRRREQAEEALQQSEKLAAVGRLTSGIAHDFNNHLTVISSNIELLKRRVPADNEVLGRLADSAIQGVQRAAALTHRLLAFSRQQPPDPEPLDAGRLVNFMSDLLRRTLGESIVVETVLAAGLWQTRVDSHQLETALLNLAVNARDAMPRGGRLTIETSNVRLDADAAARQDGASAGDYVLVVVSDTGTAGHASANAGLSMVHGFIRQAGGHVTTADVPQAGRSVRLYLPRHIRAERARPAGPATETILVVEDDEAVRRSAADALRETGYVVLEAPDAMEAFRLILDRGGIDLLFTDVGLPGGVNGRALADAARSAASDIKVLLTTGYARTTALAGDRGTHFLAKPFTPQALTLKVREVLDDRPDDAAGRLETA